MIVISPSDAVSRLEQRSPMTVTYLRGNKRVEQTSVEQAA